MTNNWYLPVDLQASGERIWPSLGWRWIREVGREDKDEILSLSSWALLYQTTCLELEPGVHSVSTVNIGPPICCKKKICKNIFPKEKVDFHPSFLLTYYMHRFSNYNKLWLFNLHKLLWVVLIFWSCVIPRGFLLPKWNQEKKRGEIEFIPWANWECDKENLWNECHVSVIFLHSTLRFSNLIAFVKCFLNQTSSCILVSWSYYIIDQGFSS